MDNKDKSLENQNFINDNNKRRSNSVPITILMLHHVCVKNTKNAQVVISTKQGHT